MKYHVSFDVEIPAEATDDQVIEWLRFQMRDNGSMMVNNPLVDWEAQPVRNTFITSRK